MDLSDSLKLLFIETAQTLKGHARRRFMAQIVKQLGAANDVPNANSGGTAKPFAKAYTN